MSDPFTIEDVERLAELARFALTPDEKQLYTRQLADFLAYAEQVRQVDTSDVPPTSHPAGAEPVMRDDEVQPSLPRAIALAQAPEASTEAGLFKVPRVIG